MTSGPSGPAAELRPKPYPEAARMLLRNAVLDAMRSLLAMRDWSKITLADVAKGAGVSRQTLYNEFGSRTGLAQAYAMRLTDQFVDHVDRAIWSHVGDPDAALTDGLTNFFIDVASDPLIRSLLVGDVQQDLMRLITVDSGPIIEHASQRLTNSFSGSWVDATPREAEVMARALVRLGMSFIAIPPSSPYDSPTEMASLFAPYVDAMWQRAKEKKG